MNMTFETIQTNLRQWMGNDLKPGTQKAQLAERAYIRGLHDAGVAVPPICALLLLSGRSIATFKAAPKTETVAD